VGAGGQHECCGAGGGCARVPKAANSPQLTLYLPGTSTAHLAFCRIAVMTADIWQSSSSAILLAWSNMFPAARGLAAWRLPHSCARLAVRRPPPNCYLPSARARWRGMLHGLLPGR
jgi:hypothetical protein